MEYFTETKRLYTPVTLQTFYDRLRLGEKMVKIVRITKNWATSYLDGLKQSPTVSDIIFAQQVTVSWL